MSGITSNIFAFSAHCIKPKENIRTFEDLDLFWNSDFRNGTSTYEAFKNITANITIGYAIEQWLKTKENPETRRKYRFGIETFFKADEGVNFGIGPEDTINTLDANWPTVGIYENILNSLKSPKTMCQLCATAYAQLCDFIRTRTRGLVDPDILPKEKNHILKQKEIFRNGYKREKKLTSIKEEDVMK